MPSNSLLCGKPYGGCAILWNVNFYGRVEPVQFISRRVCGVIIRINDLSILLANVYMPTDTEYDQQNSLEYISILHEVNALSDNLNTQHVVIGGDYNTYPTRVRSLNSPALNNFLLHNKFMSWVASDFCTADYSFESKASGSRSLLDHFVVSDTLFKLLYKADVLHSGENLSDHSPRIKKKSVV